jgi:hypothetical protein
MQFPQPVAVHHWPFGPFLLEKSVATNRSIRGNLSPPAYSILLFAVELRAP